MKLSCGGNDAAGAEHRLHDEGRDRVRALEDDLVLECGRAELGKARGVGLVERVAIEIGRGDVEAAGEQRLVVAAEIGVAVDRGAAEMGAVIALLEAQELGAVTLAADLVVLAREPQRGLDAVRAAGGEEGTGESVGREPFRQPVGKLDRRPGRRAAEGRIVGQFVRVGRRSPS